MDSIVQIESRCCTKIARGDVVDNEKFDALLKKMLASPPLPKSEIKGAKPKPKRKKPAA